MIIKFYKSNNKNIMEKIEDQPEFIFPVPFEDFLCFRKRQNEAMLCNFNIK